MSQSENPRGAKLIQASVERDQPRVIDATQLTSSEPGQPPYPGAERVLKVTVPVEPNLTEDYRLDLPIDHARRAEIDIDPCGYVEPGKIEDDELLQRWLIQTPTVDGPMVSGTGRQLLNIDLPKLLELRDEQATGVELPERNNLDRLRTLVDTHERDCETPGSHAHTLVNPQTRTVEVSANAYRASIRTSEDQIKRMPRRSVIYNELCAMVAERLDHPDIAMRLGVDRYRKRTGGQAYRLALEILEWLREHPVPERFSYQQISELLTAAGYASHPVHFLTIALYDLATGTPLEDVLHNGQYFDIKDVQSEKYYNRRSEILKNRQEQHFMRLYEQTVETVTFQSSTQEVIKEWWVRDPPAVYPPLILRDILLHRDISRFSRERFNRPYIPTTRSRPIRSRNQTVGIGYRFQDARSGLKHPYLLAMAGDEGCKEALIASGAMRTWEHKQKVVTNYADRSRIFANMFEIKNWLVGAAPDNITPKEMVLWFQ